ncbi:hypothetical protein BN946_scf185010.g23 [Trametes cinnabarina]|uniref:F-box domain-containing protein n=1 Tax=Pycnoporus cinnabarinus TaxID=5643 RepID=A0A060SRK7_PYCCI|nr:hypothetical protein BN946_scf185010.g23 [Trametes cinnabarina]
MYGPHGTAVRQAWYIDEIVRNILAHVPSIGRSKTLASCARVSRAVSEPALDMLWSRMTGLYALCELLPRSPDRFEQLVDDRASDASAIDDDASWLRFAFYARRVKRLHHHCREGPSERLHQQTFAALVRHATRLGTPLLPRLEELSWLQFSRESTECLRFLSPSLRHVTIYCNAQPSQQPVDTPGPSETFAQRGGVLLSLLNARSPDLEELSLEGIELPGPLQPLPTFNRLCSLKLGTLTASVSAILSYCSVMPTLTSLSVDLSRSDPAYFGAPDIGAPTLQALQDIKVAGSPAAVEELLQGIQSPALRSASLSLTIPEHDRDGGARCTGLLGLRFANSLESVRLEYRRSPERAHPHSQRAFAHCVRPLFAVRGLRRCTVTIEDASSTSMPDADVEAMAEAWPKMTALEVFLRSPAELPSITALAAFSRHCPDLESLRLPIAQDVPALDAVHGGHGRNGMESAAKHPLRDLWLSGVCFTLQDSRAVIRYLTRLFPDVNLLPMLGAGILRAGGVCPI